MRLWVAALVPVLAFAQDGWIDLFDGKSMAGWRGPLSDSVPKCWTVEDGALRPIQTPGYFADLWTSRTFTHFELEFEFKAATGANGGVKYLVQRGAKGRWRKGRLTVPVPEEPLEPGDVVQEFSQGLEFQILDDATLAEGKNAKTRTGAMYSIVGALDGPLAAADVFHRGRIVVRGNDIEHYVDGRRVVAVKLGSPEMEAHWDAALEPRFRNLRGLAKREGPIVLTHHGTAVWYRNLRIRELPPPLQ